MSKWNQKTLICILDLTDLVWIVLCYFELSVFSSTLFTFCFKFLFIVFIFLLFYWKICHSLYCTAFLTTIVNCYLVNDIRHVYFGNLLKPISTKFGIAKYVPFIINLCLSSEFYFLQLLFIEYFLYKLNMKKYLFFRYYPCQRYCMGNHHHSNGCHINIHFCPHILLPGNLRYT